MRTLALALALLLPLSAQAAEATHQPMEDIHTTATTLISQGWKVLSDSTEHEQHRIMLKKESHHVMCQQHDGGESCYWMN